MGARLTARFYLSGVKVIIPQATTREHIVGPEEFPIWPVSPTAAPGRHLLLSQNERNITPTPHLNQAFCPIARQNEFEHLGMLVVPAETVDQVQPVNQLKRT